jgi:hypothetical protein
MAFTFMTLFWDLVGSSGIRRITMDSGLKAMEMGFQSMILQHLVALVHHEGFFKFEFLKLIIIIFL